MKIITKKCAFWTVSKFFAATNLARNEHIPEMSSINWDILTNNSCEEYLENFLDNFTSSNDSFSNSFTSYC